MRKTTLIRAGMALYLLIASPAFAAVNVSGNWQGTITDQNTPFSAGVETVTLMLDQPTGTLNVTGTAVVASQSQSQYSINFNVTGYVGVDAVGQTVLILNEGLITAHTNPPNQSWHNFGRLHLGIDNTGNSMRGGWLNITSFGGMSITRP